MAGGADRGATTIFALASGRPPAAIAIVRCSGPEAHRAAQRIAGPLPEARCALLRELRDPGDGRLLDRALLIRFDGPHSSTGEDLVEFHCHGGRAVVDALLGALESIAGLRLAEPGEFTRRAFANGRIDLTEAEGLADLLEAETESQRRSALAMAGGALRRQIEQWRVRLVELSARAELAIDYDEEEEAALQLAESIAEDCARLAAELSAWLERPRAELLRRGLRVVVAGPANAGKSSLVNALAGDDRIIVSPFPGTTRDVVEVPLALHGLPLLIADTAGQRATDDPVEELGVARARAQVEIADILLWLGPPCAAPEHPARLIIHSKVDIDPDGTGADICLSSITRQGIDELEARLVQAARSLLPPDDLPALNRRQAMLLGRARDVLGARNSDLVLVAEALRQARGSFDALTGRAGIEDVLDALFARFCLGK